MKVNGKMTKGMVEGMRNTPMAISIKENFSMARLMEREDING